MRICRVRCVVFPMSPLRTKHNTLNLEVPMAYEWEFEFLKYYMCRQLERSLFRNAQICIRWPCHELLLLDYCSDVFTTTHSKSSSPFRPRRTQRPSTAVDSNNCLSFVRYSTWLWWWRPFVNARPNAVATHDGCASMCRSCVTECECNVVEGVGEWEKGEGPIKCILLVLLLLS